MTITNGHIRPKKLTEKCNVMKINDKIFDFLTKRDANLSDLAKKVDMDYSNFHKILKGKRKMPIEILKRLKEEYPLMDLNFIFSDLEEEEEENISMVAEDSAVYFAEKVYRKKLLEIKNIIESTNF